MYLRLAAYASNHLLLIALISALRTVSGDPISSLVALVELRIVPENRLQPCTTKALYHSAIFIAYLRLAAYASNHLLLIALD
jgi:hypothetical protein